MWRAQVRIPKELDSKIRDLAVRSTVKLRTLVEAMIDDGAAVISNQGGGYVFQAEKAWEGSALEKIEYVVSDEYRTKVDGLTAAMEGPGKRGRALAETLFIAAQKREIA